MTRRRVLVGIGVLVLLGIAGAAGAWYWNDRQTRDVRGSSTKEFETTEQTTTRAEEEIRTEPWPTYGFDVERTRVAREFDHRPPYTTVWTHRAGSLLEFPPVVAYGRLYFGTNRGLFFALDAKSGKVAWKKNVGRCSAASPTVADGVVYQPFMDPSPCAQHVQDAPGYLIAYDAETGRKKWRFKSGVNESSPALADGLLVFGTWDRNVYAVDAKTGEKRWSFATGDKVKSGVAIAKGMVFFGSYDGKVYALDLATGKLEWTSEAQGGLSGAGNFYATPTVAYGRVYVGNTDGKVYAFGAKSGDLIWAHSTGGYVYSSAAVANSLVYVGSYSKRFYALDAATGDERWSFAANGPISGAPTVLGGLVYFSTLEQRTYALDEETGKQVWDFKDGKYSPIVADEDRVYLTGYTKVYGLEPK